MEALIIKEQTPEYQWENGEIRTRHIERIQYQFKKRHKTGLNILPEYYDILYELSEGELGEYLKYLYYKYHKQIYALKVSSTKRTSTSDYQPETKRYIQITLRNMYPYIWEKYWDLRRITGYSISFIVRIFLEWELEEQSRQNELERGEPLIRKHPDIEIHYIRYPIIAVQHSYAGFKSGNSIRNDIFIYHKDIFY